MFNILSGFKYRVSDKINGFGEASKAWQENHLPYGYRDWDTHEHSLDGWNMHWGWGGPVGITLAVLAFMAFVIAAITYFYKVKLNIRGTGIFSSRKSTLGGGLKTLNLMNDNYFNYSFKTFVGLMSGSVIFAFIAFFVHSFSHSIWNVGFMWMATGLLIGAVMLGAYLMFEVFKSDRKQFIRFTFNIAAGVAVLGGVAALIILGVATRTKVDFSAHTDDGKLEAMSEWGVLSNIEGKWDGSDAWITTTVLTLSALTIGGCFWGAYLRKNAAKKTIRVFLFSLGLMLFLGSLIDAIQDTLSAINDTNGTFTYDGYALFELFPFNAYCGFNGIIIGLMLMFKRERYVYMVTPVAIIGGLSTWFVTDEMFDENIFSVGFWRFNLLHGLLIAGPIIVLVTLGEKYSFNKLINTIIYWGIWELFIGVTLVGASFHEKTNYGPNEKGSNSIWGDHGTWVWEQRTFHEKLPNLSPLQVEGVKVGVVFACIVAYWFIYNVIDACAEVSFKKNPVPVFVRNVKTFSKQTLKSTVSWPRRIKVFFSQPEKRTKEDHESSGHWIK